MTRHICPVCSQEHWVGPARQAVAWGRRLACSCACELEHRRRIREQLRHLGAPRVSEPG